MLFVGLLALLVRLLVIFVSLLVVIRMIARTGNRRTRHGARQQQADEELTHDSDLSKT